jgi:ferritin
MDPATLATSVTALLAPHIAKMGKAMMEKAIDKLPESIGGIWEAISDRFKDSPAATEAVNDLAKNAEDEDNREAFALQLKKVLKEDAEFASLLAELLEKAKSDASISNVGSGAVATNDSIAVGNVDIDGNVGGDFIIGNINKKK